MAGVADAVRYAPRIGCAALLLLALPLRAELIWSQRQVVLDPPAGASVANAVFDCVNRGPAAVRITAVQSGCECTAVVLENDAIAPGAAGRIQATFRLGGRQGNQRVTLTVATAEPEIRGYTLALVVRIQDFAVVTPQTLQWRVGETPMPKVFHVSLSNGFAFVDVSGAPPEFATEFERESADRVTLKVTPRDLWAKRSGEIKIRVAQPGKQPVEIKASVRIL